MVRLEGIASDDLFQVLEDWELVLRSEGFAETDLTDPRPGFVPKGPTP